MGPGGRFGTDLASSAAMTAEQEPITAHRWIVAGTVLTGTIMAVLDSSIVKRRAARHVGHARRDDRRDHVGRHGVHPGAGDRHADHRDHVFALVSSLFFVGFPLVFLLRRGTEPGEVELSVD